MSLEEYKAVIRNWLDARNAHDIEKALSLWSTEQQENIRKAFNGFSTTFPDLSITVNELIAEGDKVVCWWTLKGTQLGSYGAIPPTGKAVKMSAIDIYTITDGKISALERASDNLYVMRQLGVTVSWQGVEII
jgi:steroid delta-isomerase-like uncharacterized protein